MMYPSKCSDCFKNNNEYDYLLQNSEENTTSLLGAVQKTKLIDEQTSNLANAITALEAMQDRDKSFVSREYKSFQRNTFFVLLSISLVAECLYFIFQEQTSEDGEKPYFSRAFYSLCIIAAYITATGDWDANFWTVSPRDDADEHVLTDNTKSYTFYTLALIRLYYIAACISFPIGAAGGWLGLDKYTSEINNNTDYLITNSLFFALIVPAGTIYYLAWCKGLADMTFKRIDEYQKSTRHDYALARYAEVLMESASVVVYRSIGFGAIAGYIPGGFKRNINLSKSQKQLLFSFGLVSTFIVTALTRPVKVTNAWLNSLYAYVGKSDNDTYGNEYAIAEKDVNASDYFFDSKNLMSIIVGIGLAGFVVYSFETPSSLPVILGATFAAILPLYITLYALRDLRVLKKAVEQITNTTLEARRGWEKPNDNTQGCELRYKLALDGFNALAETYKQHPEITKRASGSCFLGRVARGTSFLGFTQDLSLINIYLNKMQQLCVALIFAPHNLLNEYVAFKGGMVHYLSQKYAQAYVYSCLEKEDIIFRRTLGFRCFYYGKADFTPNELIFALKMKKNELLAQRSQPAEIIENNVILRNQNQPKLKTFSESIVAITEGCYNFFSSVRNKNDGYENLSNLQNNNNNV